MYLFAYTIPKQPNSVALEWYKMAVSGRRSLTIPVYGWRWGWATHLFLSDSKNKFTKKMKCFHMLTYDVSLKNGACG